MCAQGPKNQFMVKDCLSISLFHDVKSFENNLWIGRHAIRNALGNVTIRVAAETRIDCEYGCYSPCKIHFTNRKRIRSFNVTQQLLFLQHQNRLFHQSISRILWSTSSIVCNIILLSLKPLLYQHLSNKYISALFN